MLILTSIVGPQCGYENLPLHFNTHWIFIFIKGKWNTCLIHHRVTWICENVLFLIQNVERAVFKPWFFYPNRWDLFLWFQNVTNISSTFYWNKWNVFYLLCASRARAAIHLDKWLSSSSLRRAEVSNSKYFFQIQNKMNKYAVYQIFS